MRRHLPGLVVLALLAIAAQGVFFLFDRASARAPSSTIPLARGDGTLVARAPIALERPEGPSTLPLTGVVVLHLWATWCLPCREELPVLVDAAEGQTLFAVSLDETWRTVSAYFDKGEVPTSVWRLVDEGALAPFMVRALPETIVLRDGAVVGRVVGAQRWTREALKDWIARALAP